MVAGKLLVRARYPGTGSVRLLLVGRLMRRERSAARATTNTTRSEERARKETTAIFFTSEDPREGCTIRGAIQATNGHNGRPAGRSRRKVVSFSLLFSAPI